MEIKINLFTSFFKYFKPIFFIFFTKLKSLIALKVKKMKGNRKLFLLLRIEIKNL